MPILLLFLFVPPRPTSTDCPVAEGHAYRVTLTARGTVAVPYAGGVIDVRLRRRGSACVVLPATPLAYVPLPSVPPALPSTAGAEASPWAPGFDPSRQCAPAGTVRCGGPAEGVTVAPTPETAPDSPTPPFQRRVGR